MSTALNPAEFLAVKLQRLELLLHREVLRLRARYQLSLDEFRGLYISDDQVNNLINQGVGYEGDSSIADELTKRAEVLRTDELQEDDDDVWRRLTDEFTLSRFEQDILLLALAPEFDLKYETMYGYLNNDVTRKWPTHDLALRLLANSEEEKTHLRTALAPTSTLFSSGLLQPISLSLPQVSSLASGFYASTSLLYYVLGLPDFDSHNSILFQPAEPPVDFEVTPGQREVVSAVVNLLLRTRTFPLIMFSGRDGAGRSTTARTVCSELGIPLTRVDLARLRSSSEGLDTLLKTVLLQQRLRSSALYIDRPEAFFDEQGREFPTTRQMIRSLTQCTNPVFIACDQTLKLQDLFANQRVALFEFHDPDFQTRVKLWRSTLARNNLTVTTHTLEAVADRFVLTPAQITCAVHNASDQRALESGLETDSVETFLFTAARLQSDQSLGNLASKIHSVHSWEDLVLPRTTLQRVKEISLAIRNRHVVYSEWGFERRISSGKGLKALFAGSSGTGKTMSAGIIARELGLDLYKIDLSGIVSKYIGETEKNLDRIFRAAKCSNAILFFDEADALFGKRSEVKDAHDRYANIEVAYLLQKIEDYDGVVILASNLSKNIDEAFSRRMHYVVEFPLPDENDRERLWRDMFPPEMPLGTDVDFQFLARKFPIAGGDIRNVALDAAFMAAQDSKIVTMKQLARALARQMTKQGKIPSAMDFQQYHSLITDGV